MSKNGVVTEGSWDYYPEARSLLIDRGTDKLLLNEQFIDENVMVLKKDGTDNDFYALANENTIEDYNVPQYLNSLRCKNFSIREIKMISGLKLSVHYGMNYLPKQYGDLFKNKVEFIDDDYKFQNVPDGIYVTENKENTFYIENSKIRSVEENSVETLENGETIEISDGYDVYRSIDNINRKVTINGKPISDGKFKSRRNHIYEIKESTIMNILLRESYTLKNGYKIIIEQKNDFRINKGDIIIKCEPISPIPDGVYGIKGYLFRKIKVKDSVIL